MRIVFLLFRACRSRSIVAWLVCLVLLGLSGCDYIASALPPSPSPFPTLARLPSVTPITPSPTFPPTPTLPPYPTATATPAVPMEGTVAVGANVRAAPDIDAEIVTSVVAGTDVTLLGQRDGWYQVTMTDGTEGWMSEQVLEVPFEVATAVPVLEARQSGSGDG
jgi:hypothetical protein